MTDDLLSRTISWFSVLVGVFLKDPWDKDLALSYGALALRMPNSPPVLLHDRH